jgi:predicted ArsR family transcriptional regulator
MNEDMYIEALVMKQLEYLYEEGVVVIYKIEDGRPCFRFKTQEEIAAELEAIRNS